MYVCMHAFMFQLTNASDKAKRILTHSHCTVFSMAEVDSMMFLPSLQHVIACSGSCYVRVSSTLLSSHQITQVDMLCLSHTYSDAWPPHKRPALFYICHGRLRAGAYCRCNSRPSLDRLFPPPVAVSYC